MKHISLCHKCSHFRGKIIKNYQVDLYIQPSKTKFIVHFHFKTINSEPAGGDNKKAGIVFYVVHFTINLTTLLIVSQYNLENHSCRLARI